jgi:hypothetical protein
LAFELSSLVTGAYWSAQLLTNDDSWDASRAAILKRLSEYATEEIPVSAFDDLDSWRRFRTKTGS